MLIFSKTLLDGTRIVPENYVLDRAHLTQTGDQLADYYSAKKFFTNMGYKIVSREEWYLLNKRICIGYA